MNQKNFGINVSVLIWKMLSQWKALLIVSIIFGVLACGIKYRKDLQVYNMQLEAQKEAKRVSELSKEEQVSLILDGLSEDEKAAVEYLIDEQLWVDDQKEYLSQSIVMQTDTTNQRTICMTYMISTDSITNTETIKQMYMSFLRSEEMCIFLKQHIAPDSEDQYIEELIYETDNDSSDSEMKSSEGLLQFNIILTEEADADAVTDLVVEEISKYCKKINTEHPHSISLLYSDTCYLYNSYASEKKEDAFENINALENNIRNTQSLLSEGQNSAINSILSIVREEREETERDIQPETVSAPGFSKVYALAGLLMGAAVYLLGIIIVLVLKGCINDSSDVEKYTETRLLGEIYRPAEHKGISRLLHSDFIEKRRLKNKLDIDRQMSKMIDATDSMCKMAKTTAITAFDLTKNTDDIVDAIEKNGIKVSVSDLDDEINERDLLDIKNAVLLVGNDTKIVKLEKIADLCRQYKINNLGSIYVEEI